MKVKPVEFQEDNLYRHADFAPPPQERIQPIIKQEPQRTPHRPNQVLRTRTDHLNESFGADFDDEADENLFDGVDGTETGGDEFSLDSQSVPDIAGAKTKGPSHPNSLPSTRVSPVSNTGPVRHPNLRQQLGPAGRGQPCPQQPLPVPNNGKILQNGPNARQLQTPTQQQNKAQSIQHGGRGLPQKSENGLGQRPPIQSHQTNQQSLHNQPLRPAPPQPPPPLNQARTPGQAQAEDVSSPAYTASHNSHPVGFVTSRAAEDLQKSGTSLSGLPAFNPNVESPIPAEKRTPGVNHSRSVPIKREAVNAPPAPLPPPQTIARPATSVGGGSFNRQNIVNPHLDANRRIGMPANPNYAMSPSTNRSAYKPPSFAHGGGPNNVLKRERPALQDVSNVNVNTAMNEEPDAKKQKVEPPGAENTGTGNT